MSVGAISVQLSPSLQMQTPTLAPPDGATSSAGMSTGDVAAAPALYLTVCWAAKGKTAHTG